MPYSASHHKYKGDIYHLLKNKLVKTHALTPEPHEKTIFSLLMLCKQVLNIFIAPPFLNVLSSFKHWLKGIQKSFQYFHFASLSLVLGLFL